MDGAAYVELIEQMTAACRAFALIAAGVSEEAIGHARQVIETTHALGIVVDPTGYRTALQEGRLDRQAALIDVFARTRAELKRLFPDGWPAEAAAQPHHAGGL